MAETNIKTNGSFVGDSIDEFKKLPTWGKVLAVVVVAVVAYIAYRARLSASGTSAQSAAAGTAGSATSGGSTSPFPMVGSVPLLPSGVNPIFDNSGNLAGYQQSPTSPSTPGASGTPGVDYGLIPFGSFNYKNGMSGKAYNYQGTSYTVKPGANGHIYGINSSGQQVLLYAPKSFYPGGSNYKGPSGGVGSGPGAMGNLMSNPNVYLQSAEPHLPSTVPQS